MKVKERGPKGALKNFITLKRHCCRIALFFIFENHGDLIPPLLCVPSKQFYAIYPSTHPQAGIHLHKSFIKYFWIMNTYARVCSWIIHWKSCLLKIVHWAPAEMLSKQVLIEEEVSSPLYNWSLFLPPNGIMSECAGGSLKDGAVWGAFFDVGFEVSHILLHRCNLRDGNNLLGHLVLPPASKACFSTG